MIVILIIPSTQSKIQKFQSPFIYNYLQKKETRLTIPTMVCQAFCLY